MRVCGSVFVRARAEAIITLSSAWECVPRVPGIFTHPSSLRVYMFSSLSGLISIARFMTPLPPDFPRTFIPSLSLLSPPSFSLSVVLRSLVL